MIDIKLLTFNTVAKTKNFTKAANILNMSQPAVSQHIKFIEEFYDVKLFYKEGNQMLLTEEGKVLYNYSTEMHRLSKILNRNITNVSAITRKYYVGATKTIGGYVLPNFLGHYRKINSHLDFILVVDNTASIIKKLYSGDICIGFVEGPFDKTRINYMKVKDDELVLVVSPYHKFATKESITVDELLKSKLILREKGSGTRKVFEEKLMSEGYRLKDTDVYMEIGDINALISLVESNLGCTIISQEAIKTSIDTGKLVVVPIENFKIYREFNCIYLGEVRDEYLRQFMHYCETHSHLL